MNAEIQLGSIFFHPPKETASIPRIPTFGLKVWQMQVNMPYIDTMAVYLFQEQTCSSR